VQAAYPGEVGPVDLFDVLPGRRRPGGQRQQGKDPQGGTSGRSQLPPEQLPVLRQQGRQPGNQAFLALMRNQVFVYLQGTVEFGQR